MAQFENTNFKIVSKHFHTQYLDFPDPGDGEVVSAPQSDGKSQEWTLQVATESDESPRRYYIINRGLEQDSGSRYLSVVVLDGGKYRVVGVKEKLTSWVILDIHGDGEFHLLANDNVTGYLAIGKTGGGTEIVTCPGVRSKWTLTQATVPLKPGSYTLTNVGKTMASILQGSWTFDLQPQGDYIIKKDTLSLTWIIRDDDGFVMPTLHENARQTWSLRELENKSYTITLVLQSGRQRIEYLLGLESYTNGFALNASLRAPTPAQTWTISG